MVNVIARTIRGLEWVAADEVRQLLPTARKVRLGNREVGFGLPSAAPELAELSTVDDVFLRVGQVGDVGTTKDVPDQLAARLRTLDWKPALDWVRSIRGLPDRPRFDVVVSLDGRRRFNRYALEGAAGASLARRIGGSFAERDPVHGVDGPVDLTVRLFVNGPVAVAALRLAERPMHRRAYKLSTGPGTLHPPLAAALGRLVSPRAGSVVADPFCGDGTILVELGRAGGGLRLLGADLDDERLANARANADRAGLDAPRVNAAGPGAGVTFLRADAGRLPFRAGSIDAVVTNPPWELAVERGGSLARSPGRFLAELATILSPAGVACLIVDADLDLPDQVERAGYITALDHRIRIAGRVSRILLCAPGDRPRPTLPADLADWLRRAPDL
ncbi:methyltransferase domain-containing protein [Flindersiella endophytica]